MDRYYNGLTYESLPSEDRTVKYVYLGQPSHESTFIDESVDLQYMLNNEAYRDDIMRERSSVQNMAWIGESEL